MATCTQDLIILSGRSKKAKTKKSEVRRQTKVNKKAAVSDETAAILFPCLSLRLHELYYFLLFLRLFNSSVTESGNRNHEQKDDNDGRRRFITLVRGSRGLRRLWRLRRFRRLWRLRRRNDCCVSCSATEVKSSLNFIAKQFFCFFHVLQSSLSLNRTFVLPNQMFVFALYPIMLALLRRRSHHAPSDSQAKLAFEVSQNF